MLLENTQLEIYIVGVGVWSGFLFLCFKDRGWDTDDSFCASVLLSLVWPISMWAILGRHLYNLWKETQTDDSQ